MTMLGREMSNIESREAAARVAQPSGHGPPGPGAGVAGAGQRVRTYRGHVARGFFIVLNVSHNESNIFVLAQITRLYQ